MHARQPLTRGRPNSDESGFCTSPLSGSPVLSRRRHSGQIPTLWETTQLTTLDTLRPYVDEHWEIVAVRLAPESDLDGLAGATPPLKLTFASDTIVYPMRMSRGATTSQTVTVYVAAPYKVVPQATPDPSVRPELLYAGPAEGVGELAAPASYLTAYTATYTMPQRISSDFRFARAPDNQPYQLVQIVTRNEPFWANVAILTVVHLLLLALAIGLAVLLRRREQASH